MSCVFEFCVAMSSGVLPWCSTKGLREGRGPRGQLPAVFPPWALRPTVGRGITLRPPRGASRRCLCCQLSRRRAGASRALWSCRLCVCPPPCRAAGGEREGMRSQTAIGPRLRRADAPPRATLAGRSATTRVIKFRLQARAFFTISAWPPMTARRSIVRPLSSTASMSKPGVARDFCNRQVGRGPSEPRGSERSPAPKIGLRRQCGPLTSTSTALPVSAAWWLTICANSMSFRAPFRAPQKPGRPPLTRSAQQPRSVRPWLSCTVRSRGETPVASDAHSDAHGRREPGQPEVSRRFGRSAPPLRRPLRRDGGRRCQAGGGAAAAAGGAGRGPRPGLIRAVHHRPQAPAAEECAAHHRVHAHHRRHSEVHQGGPPQAHGQTSGVQTCQTAFGRTGRR